MFSRTVGVGLIAIGLTIVLFLTPPQVHAAAVLVQQNKNECNSCSSPIQASFTSAVTAGDVIVVGVSAYGAPTGGVSLSAPTDTLSSVFTLAGSQITYAFGSDVVALYYATLTSSGSDTISASFTANGGSMYIYEVAAVTTAGVGTGSGTGVSQTATSTTPVSFQPGAFLLGIISGNCEDAPPTLGPEFKLSPFSAATRCVFAQYSTSGVTSPSTFLTGGFGDFWGAVSIALDPAPTPPPPIAEYPLGLPLLAVLALIAYGVIRRRTRNPKNI